MSSIKLRVEIQQSLKKISILQSGINSLGLKKNDYILIVNEELNRKAVGRVNPIKKSENKENIIQINQDYERDLVVKPNDIVTITKTYPIACRSLLLAPFDEVAQDFSQSLLNRNYFEVGITQGNLLFYNKKDVEYKYVVVYSYPKVDCLLINDYTILILTQDSFISKNYDNKREIKNFKEKYKIVAPKIKNNLYLRFINYGKNQPLDHEYILNKYDMLKRDFNLPSLWYDLAVVYYQKKDYIKAKNYAKEHLIIVKNNPYAIDIIASCYKKLNRENKAEKLLIEQVSQNPLSEISWIFLILYYIEKNQIERAKEYIDECIINLPTATSPFKLLADVYIKEKNNEKAIEALYNAIDIKRNDWEAWYKLALVFISEYKYRPALEAVNYGLSSEKNDILWNTYAIINVYLQNFKEALKGITKAIRLSINQYKDVYYTSKSNIYVNLGDLEKAEKWCEKAFKIKSNSKYAWNSLGVIRKKQKNLEEATSAFKKAIAIDDKYANCLTNLGYTEFKKGNVKKAIESILKSIELQPELYIPYFHLSKIYYKTGDFKKAETFILKLLTIHPFHKKGLILKERIEEKLQDGME